MEGENFGFRHPTPSIGNENFRVGVVVPLKLLIRTVILIKCYF